MTLRSLEKHSFGPGGSNYSSGYYKSDPFTTTDSDVVIDLSEFDTRGWPQIAFRVKNTGAQSLTFTVFDAMEEDFSDEDTAATAQAVAAGAVETVIIGAFSNPRNARYHRVKVKSTTPATPTTGILWINAERTPGVV
jgi:hypothetical protein